MMPQGLLGKDSLRRPFARLAHITQKRGSFLSRGDRQAVACDWPRHVQQRAKTLARMLKPFGLVGATKTRVGGGGDGGYVMVDDFAGIETAFSLGVGPNVDWDYEIAERGIAVHQFDHTVPGPPRSHPGFQFHPQMIATEKTERSETLVTVLDHAATHDVASNILKMDIENHEWAVFATATQDVFEKFSQIICEFHAFNYLHEDEQYEVALRGLQNLKEQFEVVHVHANNCHGLAGITYIDGFPLPFVLEVTLVNCHRYNTRPTGETFPTPLDLPNDLSKPDYDLGRFEI